MFSTSKLHWPRPRTCSHTHTHTHAPWKQSRQIRYSPSDGLYVHANERVGQLHHPPSFVNGFPLTYKTTNNKTQQHPPPASPWHTQVTRMLDPSASSTSAVQLNPRPRTFSLQRDSMTWFEEKKARRPLTQHANFRPCSHTQILSSPNFATR